MEEIKFDYLTIQYEAPFVYHRYTKSIMIDVEKIKEIIDADEKLSKGKPYLLLSDTRMQIEMSPDAYKEVQEDLRTGKIIANAVVVKWLAQRLVAKVFSDVNKPIHPFEVFSDEAEAVKWLLAQEKIVSAKLEAAKY